ncbi:MAG: ABC transporter ATP-binding protein/permease [Alphaproteobacteria bacterium]|nr:ABC transporter ATP-binding protein/permease [Alphaproteobacteria bacterium]MBU0796809.1 ABC transporter ATP-binding protein/permease [Alphaproteobacteria bacterium]MBU0885833.1 ABC transporter ATP-binding protein/permease [Alphaproteobacteria bacterium]MBU1812090.1 ABC transporter ATP-binding protein/permease [Alphaproteobacteria bacterium]MBU2092066.1 ABC transporter ATP-binding protein/permease [Alphaproteobacteria bacterium]
MTQRQRGTPSKTSPLKDGVRLLRSVLPDRRRTTFLLAVLGILAAFAEGSALILLSLILAPLQGSGDMLLRANWSISEILGLYSAIVLASAVVMLLRGRFVARHKIGVIDRLRRDLQRALFAQRWTTLRDIDSSYTIQLAMSECNRIGQGVDYLFQAIGLLVKIPILFFVTWLLSPVMALMTVALLISAGWIIARHERRLRNAGDQLVQNHRRLHSQLTDSLAGRRLVKSLGLENAYRQRWENALSEAASAQLVQQQLLVTNQTLMATAMAFAIALGLLVATAFFAMPLSDSVVFGLAFGRLAQTLLRLRQSWNIVVMALPAESVISDFLARARASAEPAAQQVAPTLSRSIRLDGVTSQYPDGTVALEAINAEILAGQITVIVGHSGAGKSTLADMLAGLTLPTAGQVLIDGKALQEEHLIDWRRQVAYLPQDDFLFNDTLKANLLIGRPECSEPEIWRALDQAGVAATVESLPQGLETLVGERGARLSGGERQRIGLARCLLRKARLLVLDEPSSALDQESEAIFLKAIMGLAPDYTIVMISHRESTEAIAHRIIRLDHAHLLRQTDRHA